jgi:hypothetical protein
MQLKYLNLFCICIYLTGNLMSLLSGICCMTLYAEIVMTTVGGIAITMIIYSYRTNQIKLNFWISAMICARVILGLFHFDGNYEIKIASSLIFCFSTFFIIDAFCFMLINISYGTKILIPISLQLLACVALLQFIFSIVEWPD